MHASQQTININNALYAKVNARNATLPKFHVGDKVRIMRTKGTFEKGLHPIGQRRYLPLQLRKQLNHQYILIDDTMGEPVQGTFYEQELQSSVQEIYRIERVLKRGKDRVLVKWLGYSSAFNSWIPLADLEQL